MAVLYRFYCTLNVCVQTYLYIYIYIYENWWLWNILHHSGSSSSILIDITISVAKLLMFIAIFIKMLLELPEGHNIFQNPKFSYIYNVLVSNTLNGPVHEIIRIHNDCDKSVPKFTNCHHEACRVDTIGDHEGRIILSHPHANNEFVFIV